MTKPISRTGPPRPICHGLLDALGVEHGFGVRGAPPRDDVACPVQVHGVAVARVDTTGVCEPREADAIVTTKRGQCVGIVTADCVPILAASADGRAVAAIHAGWRGLAAGVVGLGLRALHSHVAPDQRNESLRAVIGPHIGPCCYEVDEPVTSALQQRFGGGSTDGALKATRAGHALLDLAALVECELEREGISKALRARVAGCTQCEPDRFHSYRRDADRAGRLLHFISPR